MTLSSKPAGFDMDSAKAAMEYFTKALRDAAPVAPYFVLCSKLSRRAWSGSLTSGIGVALFRRTLPL
jgi:hypothetical protein